MSGQYRTIVADPPWPYRGTSGPHRNDRATGRRQRRPMPYSVLGVAEIAALPVEGMAAPDAHLYLWTTSAFLEPAYTVARSWGFTPSTVLIWCKAPCGMGLGGAFAITSEFILFCRRGSLPPQRREGRNWWQWPRGRHSRKPEGFQDLVEQVSPGPYLELFARRPRLGWDVWGNEVESSIAMAAD